MDAWILRLPKYRPTFGGYLHVTVLHVTADGDETELEVLEMDSCENHLGHLVEAQIQKGHRRLILDLCAIKQIDAASLGEIVGAFNRAEKSGGELVVAAADSNVRKVIRLTGIDRVVPTFDSLQVAVRHFCP